MKYLSLIAISIAVVCTACSHDEEPDRTGSLLPPETDAGVGQAYDFTPHIADKTLRIEAVDGTIALRYDRAGMLMIEDPDGVVRLIDVTTDIDASLRVTPDDTTLTVRSCRIDPIFVRREHTESGRAWYHILSVDSVRYVAVVPCLD